MVLDNDPCHGGIKENLRENYPQVKLLRLGPYSPMLNPIEHVWSQVKAHIKRNLQERIDDVLNRNSNETLCGRRKRMLKELMLEGLRLVTPKDCKKHIELVEKDLVKALSGTHMHF